MPDIKGALTRKFGPLPAWGWLGIGGGGIWYYRRHAASGGSQQAAAMQYPASVGPWGQDPYGIQGGAGTASDSGGNAGGTSGTNTGSTGSANGGGAPTINVAAPTAPGGTHGEFEIRGRARAHKPHPKHTRKPPTKPKGNKKTAARHPAATHNNARAKGVGKAGSAFSKPRTLAPAHKAPPVKQSARHPAHKNKH